MRQIFSTRAFVFVFCCFSFLLVACSDDGRFPDDLAPSDTVTLASLNGMEISVAQFRKRVRLEQVELQDRAVYLRKLEEEFGANEYITANLRNIENLLLEPERLGAPVWTHLLREILIRDEAARRNLIVDKEDVDGLLRSLVSTAEGGIVSPWRLFSPLSGEALEMQSISQSIYEQRLLTLDQRLRKDVGMSLDEYREVLQLRLFTEKLEDSIADESVSTTEDQVRARHILIYVDARRSEADALEIITKLRQEIFDGSDFADIAATQSEDLSSSADGGDLGWFNREQWVEEFTDAAFSLAFGEISEPVKTRFGYHLIQILEEHPNRPKDQSRLSQESRQAFQAWLDGALAEAAIAEPDSFVPYLPRFEQRPSTDAVFFGAQHYVDRGKTASEDEMYEAALELLDIAIGLQPDHIEAHYERGQIHYNLAGYAQAVHDFSRVVEQDPRHTDAYYWRGRSREQLGLYDEAILDQTKVMVLDPEYVDAYYSRGYIYLLLLDYENALTDFDRFLEVNPSDASAHSNRALALTSLGSHGEALIAFGQSIEIDPEDPYTYNNRGIAYLNLEQYRNALADFTRTIELNPDFVAAHYNRGVAYHNLEMYEEAIVEYENALKMDPNYTSAEEGIELAREALEEIGSSE
ncbi:tetratricopeptide repeat protein [Chloroflexi bacterium TSY]|nr:tetratricopeptide repeat protein [Chloroflexi bacterium TSY]